MPIKHSPATPLPWQDHSPHGEKQGIGVIGTHYGRFQVPSRNDAAYIAHAANAYPRLVAALRSAIAADPSMATGDGHLAGAAALLRELGEAE